MTAICTFCSGMKLLAKYHHLWGHQSWKLVLNFFTKDEKISTAWKQWGNPIPLLLHLWMSLWSSHMFLFLFKPLRPSNAFIHERICSSLFHMMVCYMVSAKPLHNSMLNYHLSDFRDKYHNEILSKLKYSHPGIYTGIYHLPFFERHDISIDNLNSIPIITSGPFY